MGHFFMRERFKNILVVAGSGRNCGKTSFINQLIKACSGHKITAIKITPHFHPPTEGLEILYSEEKYHIFKETNRSSEKDSSRFLQAGANSSFYIQVVDEYLEDAFKTCLNFIDLEQPLIIESAKLAQIIQPALFLFIHKKHKEIKSSASGIIKLADQIIISDGAAFDLQPDKIEFNQQWKISKT